MWYKGTWYLLRNSFCSVRLVCFTTIVTWSNHFGLLFYVNPFHESYYYFDYSISSPVWWVRRLCAAGRRLPWRAADARWPTLCPGAAKGSPSPNLCRWRSIGCRLKNILLLPLCLRPKRELLPRSEEKN